MNLGSLDVAEKKPTLLQRVRGALDCWYVLLRDKLVRQSRGGFQVTNCLQLKKGTRFRLSGGEVELLEDDHASRGGTRLSNQTIKQTAATRGSASY